VVKKGSGTGYCGQKARSFGRETAKEGKLGGFMGALNIGRPEWGKRSEYLTVRIKKLVSQNV